MQVELQRFERCGVMIVDGGEETQTANSPGTFTALNINTGLLFLGSIPGFVNHVSLLQEGFEVYKTNLLIRISLSLNCHYCELLIFQRPPGVLACFHALSINGVYESLK